MYRYNLAQNSFMTWDTSFEKLAFNVIDFCQTNVFKVCSKKLLLLKSTKKGLCREFYIFQNMIFKWNFCNTFFSWFSLFCVDITFKSCIKYSDSFAVSHSPFAPGDGAAGPYSDSLKNKTNLKLVQSMQINHSDKS